MHLGNLKTLVLQRQSAMAKTVYERENSIGASVTNLI